MDEQIIFYHCESSFYITKHGSNDNISLISRKHKFYQLLFLVPFIFIHCSCTQNKSDKNQRNEAPVLNLLKSDTLIFTSGIRAIHQDQKGNYWIGSHQEGAAQYDGQSFTYFTTKEGLPDNQVRTIEDDEAGNIWFGTAHGVSRYDGLNIINESPVVSEFIFNEWKESGKDLWFGAGNHVGVYRYDGQNVNFLAFPNPKVVNPNNSYLVTSIAKGKDTIWIGTFPGVFGFDGKVISVIDDESLGRNQENGWLHVRSVFEDSKGRLWIGNNGIGVLLKEGEKIIHFSEKYGLIHPSSARSGQKSQPGTLEHVFAIAEDAAGNIWFGDRDTGAWKFDGTTIQNYTVDSDLDSPMIWTIYKDRQNKMLFGMAKGGVYYFNGTGFDKVF